MFRVVQSQGGVLVIVSLLQDFVLDNLVRFLNKGEGNNKAADHIFDVRVQRVEKFLRKDPSHSEFVPFVLTVRKTKIDASNEQFKKMQETFQKQVAIVFNPMAPPAPLPVDKIGEMIRQQQIALMFPGQLKELKKGNRSEISAYDYKVNR